MTASNVLAFSMLAAALPVLVYVGLIYWADRYEKEPWWLLSAAFLWGALPGALLALFFNMLLSLPLYALLSEESAGFATGSFIAPVVEEVAKGLILLLIMFAWRNEIDSPLDGIIYGAMVGMGFAMVENVLYYVSVYQEAGQAGWTSLVLIRGLAFGLSHAFYASLTGLGIALSRLSRHRVVQVTAPFLGLLAAVLFHALHNATLYQPGLLALLATLTFDWGGVAVTATIVVLSLRQERRWMKRYLREEVAMGTLSAADYDRVASGLLRNRYRWRLLATDGFRAYRRAGQRFHYCSELAYRKRHHARFHDAGSREAIDRLRQRITALGREAGGAT